MAMSSRLDEIITRVGAIRKKLGAISLRALAIEISVEYNTLQTFMKNGRMGHAISKEFLKNGYSVDWIMTGDGSMFRENSGGNFVPQQILDVMGELVADKKALTAERDVLHGRLKNLARDEKTTAEKP